MDVEHSGTGKRDKRRAVPWAQMGSYCLTFLAGIFLGVVLARFILWPLILKLFLIPVMFG